MKRERLFLFLLVLSFAILFVEARYLHSGILEKKPFAWIPTILLPVLAIGTLFGLSHSRAARGVALAVLIVGAVAGLVGIYFHTDGLKAERFTMLLRTKPEKEEARSEGMRRSEEPEQAREEARQTEESEQNKEEGEEGKEEEPPAPLNSLAMTGLSLFGLIVLWPDKSH